MPRPIPRLTAALDTQQLLLFEAPATVPAKPPVVAPDAPTAPLAKPVSIASVLAPAVFRHPLADREIVLDSLAQTEVAELKDRPIQALSGGQRQRVLLARMLARRAEVLLLDEPLTGVDAATQEKIMRLLQGEARAGRTVVMVTHDLEAAARWCDQLLLVNRTVVAQGTPEQVYTPSNIECTFSSSHLGHTHAHA